jgi:hypothetical protein
MKLASLLLLASCAHGQYANGYTYCKVITVNSPSMISGSSNLTNYTLDVILTDSILKTVSNGGHVNNANGYDIGFYNDTTCTGTGTKLNWDMESPGTGYNPATGFIAFHVMRNTFPHGANDVFSMYYGGSYSSNQGTPTSAWRVALTGVWHLGSLTAESTSNGLTLTNNGTTATTGQIDGAAAFSGSSSYDTQASTSALQFNYGDSVSISGWFNFSSISGSQTLLGNLNAPSTFQGWEIEQNANQLLFFLVNSFPSTAAIAYTTGTPISVGWHHVYVTYSGNHDTSGMLFYVDGSLVASGTVASYNTLGTNSTVNGLNTFFGQRRDNTQPFTGSMDEIRVATQVVSSDWILTEYRNEHAPGTYISEGSEQTAGGGGGCGTVTVNKIETTNTQAKITYTTSSSGVCTLNVSESSTLTPVVHDLDASLFTNANQDAGGAAGTRVWIVGKRLSAQALDGHTYSRSLHAFHAHYYQFVGGTATGNFVTRNIPTGRTFNDGPQVDPSTPGGWVLPMNTTTRGYQVLDPNTGALLTSVSIDNDAAGVGGSQGMYLGTGGFSRQCSPTLFPAPDSTRGYLCVFWEYQQEDGLLYYLPRQPTVATPRCLGGIYVSPFPGKPTIDALGQNYFYTNTIVPNGYYRATYIGNYLDVGANCASTAAAFSTPQLYSQYDIGTFLNIYDSTYNNTTYDCGFANAIAGQTAGFFCAPRGGSTQDVTGWLGVMDGGDGRPFDPAHSAYPWPHVIAGWNLSIIPTAPDCLNHNWQNVPNSNNLLFVNLKSFAGDCSIGGFAAVAWWVYLSDPHGFGVTTDPYFPYGGHLDTGPLGKVTEASSSGWDWLLGVPLSSTNGMPLTNMTDSPAFAGVVGFGFGDSTNKHPSYQQTDAQTTYGNKIWFDDQVSFSGTDSIAPFGSAVLVVGTTSTYKYNYSPTSPGALPIHRKFVPTLASNGGNSLLDVSSPATGNIVTDSTPYTYCTANLANECRTGSSPGDTFVSVPTLSSVCGTGSQPCTQCTGGEGPLPQNLDICISDFPSWGQTLPQIYMGASTLDATQKSRNITGGLAGIKDMFFYSNAKQLPDASSTLFTVGIGAFGKTVNVWMADFPPSQNWDTVARDSFEQIPIKLTAPVGLSVTNAVVDFGYLESGPLATTTNYYCTSRQEKCVAGTTVSPYAFPTDGTAGVDSGLTGTACSSTCTISLPAVPGRMLYYQVRYRNSSNATVSTAAQQIIIVP